MSASLPSDNSNHNSTSRGTCASLFNAASKAAFYGGAATTALSAALSMYTSSSHCPSPGSFLHDAAKTADLRNVTTCAAYTTVAGLAGLGLSMWLGEDGKSATIKTAAPTDEKL